MAGGFALKKKKNLTYRQKWTFLQNNSTAKGRDILKDKVTMYLWCEILRFGLINYSEMFAFFLKSRFRESYGSLRRVLREDELYAPKWHLFPPPRKTVWLFWQWIKLNLIGWGTLNQNITESQVFLSHLPQFRHLWCERVWKNTDL